MNELDEVINKVSIDISDVESYAILSFGAATKASAILQKILELHEVITDKEDKKKEDICLLCEESYPCETVEIIFNGFEYSRK
jgi:hypothetical protein